jgi:alpha-mannosidase
MNKYYHIISHTHWDREWYEPFERFRIRLVRLVDNLLELLEKEPDYIFHLDAQTAVVEDYLEVKPYNRSRLEKYIREARILVGPWFIQNDFFLTSGESTVRNLLLGISQAEKLGHCEYVGYAPDQFGLPSQLPMILNGFNIESVVFGRGRICKDEHGGKSEFLWKSKDGSEILAVQMPNFYNNAQRFSENMEKSKALLSKVHDELSPVSSTEHLLLMNGVDHLEPQENLLEILPDLKQGLPEKSKIFQDSLSNYCDTVRAKLSNPVTHLGELRHGGDRGILQGTLSSRSYLKAENVRAEKAITAHLEPLCIMLLMSGFRIEEYDKDFLNYLWKLLLTNHPHDSICGCSCDAVHRHMEDRYRRFFEVVEHMLAEKLTLIGQHISGTNCDESDYYVNVVNTAVYSRKQTVTAQIDIKLDEKIKAFKLVSENGEEIPYEIIDHQITERGVRSPVNLPGKILVDRYKIKFQAIVPAFGYSRYLIKKSETFKKTANTLGFENKFLKVTVSANGQIDIFDKVNQQKFNNVLWLEDTADFGDSYSYRPDHESSVISSAGLTPRIEYIQNNSIETVCKLKYNLVLPAFYDRQHQRRSEETVISPVEIILSLSVESKKLEILFNIDNKAEDHCLRAIINSGIKSNYSYASAPFDIIRRDKHNGDIVKRDDPQEPTSDFVYIHNKQKGISILHQGIHAYEHFKNRKGQIAMTLLRATGYIQGYFEIPLDEDWLVPENQCLRKIQCKMALMSVSPETKPELIAQEAADYLNPLLVFSDSCSFRKFTGGRPCVQDSDISEIFYREDPNKHIELPGKNSFLQCNNKRILLVACKKAEKNNDFVIRLLNVGDSNQVCKINFGFQVKSAHLANLKEEKKDKIEIEELKQIRLEFKPGEIISIIIGR